EEIRSRECDLSELDLNSRSHEFLLDGRGSHLWLGDNALPDSISTINVQNWSWYGGSAASRGTRQATALHARLEKIRRDAEEQDGMKYGIGGFWEILPGELALTDSTSFSMAYADEECVGFPESELRLFREDKVNQNWEYVGGVVDESNNRVTSPLTRFGCYTLAPRLPRGTIRVQTNPEVLPADSLSTSTISFGPILNNDSTQVADGTLLTVSCDQEGCWGKMQAPPGKDCSCPFWVAWPSVSC
ncbi:MAG: hypothetical protein KDC10_06405, partial [Calditrichaeota bacterium]|nr:hypothetical protein [Calditrichota bacterium]